MTMTDPRSINRGMFWRIERRLLSANRGRAFVILLALGAGAAVTASLLNLQVDAKRRITSEFRSFGANVILVPRGAESASAGATLDQKVAETAANSLSNRLSSASADLYLIANVHTAASAAPVPVVIDGKERIPARASAAAPATAGAACDVGSKVATQLQLKERATLFLQAAGREASCRVRSILSTGDASDNQIILPLTDAQHLAALPGRVSAVQLSIPGKPQEIAASIAFLQSRLPGVDVRPILQFTEGETKIYNRISGVLNATVAVILILTALCVTAAMTNIAMERKNDVALMKAIGGAARRVIRFFLVEAALLGLAGGLLGAAFGLLLSIWLGKAVFGVAAEPRFVVYPVSVALTVIVAIFGAFPLRRLAEVRPASIFRGEQ
jgi:putative ABC transport system permease protein